MFKWKSQLISKLFYPKQGNDKTAEIIQFSHKYRGRELLGFSNYKMFEVFLQKHVATLKAPAIKLLNTIKGIVTHFYVHVRVLTIKPND